MEFSNIDEFYDYLNLASPKSLLEIANMHKDCWAGLNICEFESKHISNNDLEGYILEEVAQAPNTTEEVLNLLLEFKCEDFYQNEALKYAILKSNSLTPEILKRIYPSDHRMAAFIIGHRLATDELKSTIYKDFDSEVIATYLN